MHETAPRLPTIRDVLALDPVRRGRPCVRAARSLLDSEVRWVHVTELSDVGELLHGGELILTTGIGLGETPRELTRFVDGLSRAGVVGVFIELGRRFDRLPEALLARAEERQLLGVELASEIPFIDVTQAVHSLVVSSQLARLEKLVATDEQFTSLSVRGAATGDILELARSLAGGDVLFEDASGRVLGLASSRPSPKVIDEWLDGRAEGAANVVVAVEARGRKWGRVALIGAGGMSSDELSTVVLQRCAQTLALNQLIDQDDRTLELQAHASLLSDLAGAPGLTDEELRSRAKALGQDLEGTLAGVCVRIAGRAPVEEGTASEHASRSDARLVRRAAHLAGVPALVRAAGIGTVELVVALGDGPADARLTRLVESIRTEFRSASPIGIDIGVGSAVESSPQIARSLLEAGQAATAGLGGHRPFYRLDDVRIRGLAQLLRDDPRVETFVERELGALLTRDGDDPSQGLLATLREFVSSGGHKSRAAKSLGLSRPALYHRIERLERLLGADLMNPESRTSLHLALLCHEARVASERASAAERGRT